MTILKQLIEEKLQREGKSARAAADEIGVSHLTVYNALNEKPLDVDILQQFANWLGVNLSSVIDAEGGGKGALAAQIALVLETEPRLAAVFGEAMSRVLEGKMTPQEFRDLAAYASFRLHIQSEGDIVDGAEEKQH